MSGLILKGRRPPNPRPCRYLESVYSDTFFVPLTVTGLAMVSRINACASQILETDLPEAQQRMLDKLTSSRQPDHRSVNMM